MSDFASAASRLNQLIAMINAQGSAAEVGHLTEASELARRLLSVDREVVLPVHAQLLSKLGEKLASLGRHGDAAPVMRDAVTTFRHLAADAKDAFLPGLASSLAALAKLPSVNAAQGLAAAQEAVVLYRGLIRVDENEHVPALARSLGTLSDALDAAGRRAEAHACAREAISHFRRLARTNPAFLIDLAAGANNLAGSLSDAGAAEEALTFAREAVASFRELADDDPHPFLVTFLNTLARSLRDVGAREEGLSVATEAFTIGRVFAAEVVANNGRLSQALDCAMSLNTAAAILRELSRLDEAVPLMRESVQLCALLKGTDQWREWPDLLAYPSNLAAVLDDLGRHHEAVEAARQSVDMLREALAADPAHRQVRRLLAVGLTNLSRSLSELKRPRDALDAVEEALRIYRGLPAESLREFDPHFAMCLHNASSYYATFGRNEDALRAAQEATAVRRRLANEVPEVYGIDLVMSLTMLRGALARAGRVADADSIAVEAAALLLELRPDDVQRWCSYASSVNGFLGKAAYLRRWHLPLLRLLVEHRELAFDDGHVQRFLVLQAETAARAWTLLATLGPQEGELLDEVVAVLVASLHSPDLARWMQARGTEAGALMELARRKRDVIDADQALEAQLGQVGGRSPGARAQDGFPRSPETEERLRVLSRNAQKARAAFRTERQRVIETDVQVRSVFEVPGMAAIRRAARHGGAAAALCLLQLPGASPGSPRTVGALVDVQGAPTRLLEFDRLHETAAGFEDYQPLGERNRLAVFRRGEEATSSADAPLADHDAFETLAGQLHDRFWNPLRRACQERGVERLHVCGHGSLQQLPLGLCDDNPGPALQVLAWPGLPYLRMAEARTQRPGQSDRPWLIGHDCAWSSEQPLPMVALEATLLRLLLEQHGRAVQEIADAASLPPTGAGLVVCCHGVRRAAAFDSALALGSGEVLLSVRTILQQAFHPALAVLPACHAGETIEDRAGNALGLAAGFLLAGSEVVAASPKAVPDVLMPWLSTLVVWHVLHEASAQRAAHLAREQFGRGDFPPAYRSWLQRELPRALATLQPGGAAYAAARATPRGMAAINDALRAWPWLGDATLLVDADPARRRQATEDIASNVLRPRDDDLGELLPKALRELAAYIFVYGC